jgi:hypothetical protein
MPEKIIHPAPARRSEIMDFLLKAMGPRRRSPSVPRQWLIWLILALAMATGVTGLIHPQADLIQRLKDPAASFFLLLAFSGSALAAWIGIASSMPGAEASPRLKFLMGGILLVLFAMPFLFFSRDTLQAVMDHGRESHWFCVKSMVGTAFWPWIAVGWMVSRNASFHPGWTGAWLGLSAFLLGTGTVQLHCSHWECCHMLLNHLLPMVVFLFIPIWAGTYWFSRWAR